MGRQLVFFNFKLLIPQPLEELLHKYSQRSNTIPLLPLSFLGFFLGTMMFYIGHKITVHEAKWAANYGEDVPYYTTFWYQ